MTPEFFDRAEVRRGHADASGEAVHGLVALGPATVSAGWYDLLKARIALLPLTRSTPGGYRQDVHASRIHGALDVTPQLKIVVEKHSDGYIAYPLGLARGVIVGQGDSYDAALSDVRSAIAFHLETFGPAALASAKDDPVLEAFVAETTVPA